MERKNRLAIVVPCYNEEETLQTTVNVLTDLLKDLINKGKIAKDSVMLLVNDGSKDKTWSIIETNTHNNQYVQGLKLAHNVGHQSALYAGLDIAKDYFDITVSIDADLQDDVGVIEQMIDNYKQGDEIVYGVRNDRTSDSFFKKTTAESFYKLIESFGVETVYNHADFRLMSKLAVEKLCEHKEHNLYLRGIVPKIGYNTSKVEYKRKAREAGESKYNLKSMLRLATDGITAFSNKPIDMIFKFGCYTLLFSLLTLLTIGFIHIFYCPINMALYIIDSILIMGSINIIALGIIGQYIGRINIETKQRPRYIIEKYITD